MDWKKIITVIIIIPLFGCNKNECKGEPASIDFNEKLSVKIKNESGENIFNSGYSIDSLKIFEDDDTLEFINEDDYSISFVSKVSSFDTIKESYELNNSSISTRIYFQLNNNDTDTLEIITNPVYEEENCGARYYSKVKIIFNNLLIKKYEDDRGCISCGNTIILTKK